ncbi:MAG: L,D-transpeptidase family protein [Blastocatellia bacterium]
MEWNVNLRYFRLSRSHFAGPVVAALVIACASKDQVLAQPGLAARQQRSSRSQPAPTLSLRTEEIREAEQRLSDLGYWTGPVDGALDVGSRQALIAFRKVEGQKRTGKLTLEELQALRTAKRPPPRESGHVHIEIDLTRQVLFAVDLSGLVSKILPVSTGTGKLFTAEGWTRRAVTPCGRFTISHKISGWRKSPLGLLYYPNYIVGGIAIHGNPSVPVYPASHGCIRIPMFAAKQFSEINPVGTVVIVYYSDAVE